MASMQLAERTCQCLQIWIYGAVQQQSASGAVSVPAGTIYCCWVVALHMIVKQVSPQARGAGHLGPRLLVSYAPAYHLAGCPSSQGHLQHC